MSIINSLTLNTYATRFLTLEGEVNTTVKNVIKHHKNANIVSVECPDENFTFTLEDGTKEIVKSEVIYLRLTSASKSSLEDLASWKYGRVVKGILLTEYATSVYTGVVKETSKAIKNILSAKTVLLQDIKSSYAVVIKGLNDTVTSISEELLTDYLGIVEKNGVLTVDGIAIDCSNTVKQVNLEALQETLEQITSCFLIGKSEVDVNIIDANNIEVNLSSWDSNNNQIAIDKLKLFNINTCLFDSDKTGVLKKLSVQIVSIKL